MHSEPKAVWPHIHCKKGLVILTTVLVISIPSMQDGDSCNSFTMHVIWLLNPARISMSNERKLQQHLHKCSL